MVEKVYLEASWWLKATNLNVWNTFFLLFYFPTGGKLVEKVDQGPPDVT